MKSQKEYALDKKIKVLVKENKDICNFVSAVMSDEELHELQEYANTVSIRRLKYNDHGPVHMRQVALNALKMLSLLNEAGIKTSLVEDETGSYEDSFCAVFAAAFMHDIGMAIGRQGHEHISCILAVPILDRILGSLFPVHRRTIIKAVALEGIAGHMATQKIHSVEAGLILVADGCDMEFGRARIPMSISSVPRIGDIHKYSANSILKVVISKGDVKPVKIDIDMENDAGFFQVEEVLLPKVESSPVKKYIEVFAGVKGERKAYQL